MVAELRGAFLALLYLAMSCLLVAPSRHDVSVHALAMLAAHTRHDVSMCVPNGSRALLPPSLPSSQICDVQIIENNGSAGNTAKLDGETTRGDLRPYIGGFRKIGVITHFGVPT